MKKDKTVELQMSPEGPFYSQFDEDAMFEWFNKIKAIKKYEGQHKTLYIEVSLSIHKYELMELFAVFYRYKIDMKQLAVFNQGKLANWFKDSEEAYWYKSVYGKNKKITKKQPEKPLLKAKSKAKPKAKKSTK